jgi:hypothetical protein
VPQFEKGAKPGPGRPKGSKEKKYLNLKFWFDLLETELAKKITITRRTKDGLFVDSWVTTAVDPNTRAQLFLNAMKMLTAKMKQLPTTPGDSVENAEEAMKELNAIETSLRPTKPQSLDTTVVPKPI